MDDESGDDERDELTSGRGGESRQEWWGWRNESGSWFLRRGDAYLNERSVIFKEMVGVKNIFSQYEIQIHNVYDMKKIIQNTFFGKDP